MSSRFSTVYVPGYLAEERAEYLYEIARTFLDPLWEKGPRSSRLATAQSADFIPEIGEVIREIVDEYIPRSLVYNCYYNLYEDGSMYTPNHSHPGTLQIIISLGPGIRTLKVGKKNYPQHPGTLTIFGSSTHGVAREPHIRDPRIGVAVFCTRERVHVALKVKRVLVYELDGEELMIELSSDEGDELWEGEK